MNRLADLLHFLNSSGDKSQDSTRFWFDTRANLRREMEDRKRRFDEKTEVRNKVSDALKKLLSGASSFSGVHVFTPHSDVPDDNSLRLIVLPPECFYTREESRHAVQAVMDATAKHGTGPRHRGNRLLFLAPDLASMARLNDAARTVLAWDSIVDDVKQSRLNIDVIQKKQAEKELQTAEDVLPRAARETYRWLLSPLQENPKDPKPSVEPFQLNTAGGTVGSEVERVCSENELVITAWSPIHLRTKLKELYWTNGLTHTGAKAFWEDTLRYYYLPRLKGQNVLEQAVRTGAATRDFFAIAYGQTGDIFEGFRFGTSDVQFDDTLILIEPGAALAYEDAHRPAPFPDPPPIDPTNPVPPPPPTPPPPIPPAPMPPKKPRSFHGTAYIKAATSKMHFTALSDEVIAVLCSDPNATVKVTVEISADFPEGATDQIKRAVSENSRTLDLKTADWE